MGIFIGILMILFTVVIGTMAVCFVLGLNGKAHGDEKKYEVFTQAANRIYWRLVLFLILIFAIVALLNYWR